MRKIGIWADPYLKQYIFSGEFRLFRYNNFFARPPGDFRYTHNFLLALRAIFGKNNSVFARPPSDFRYTILCGLGFKQHGFARGGA
jgi:hypothetical protein